MKQILLPDSILPSTVLLVLYTYNLKTQVICWFSIQGVSMQKNKGVGVVSCKAKTYLACWRLPLLFSSPKPLKGSPKASLILVSLIT